MYRPKLQKEQNMAQNESLLATHPIFRMFKSETFMFEQCERINSHGVAQNRHVVFHTSGVFILESKTFQRSYSISQFIPLYFVTALVVSKESLLVKTASTTLELRLKEHIKLSAHIYIVHTVLFDHQNIPFTFEIDPNLRKAFDSIDFNYQTNFLTSSRFLGMVLASKQTFNEEMCKNTYDSLSIDISRFHVTQGMLLNPYIYEVSVCLSLSCETQTLIIEGIDLGEYIPSLKQIINNSISIRNLILRGIRINSHFNDFKVLFKDQHLLRLDELAFERCRILHPESNIFFDSFSHSESNIKLLRVEACMMTQTTLDSIFQSLFFSPCFHSLENLIITDVSLSEDLSAFVFQLLCCGWVLQKRCLRNLSLRNCGLKVCELLNNLKDLDCGILSLDLGFNSIVGIPVSLGLHSLSSLILDHCNFSGDMLLQFFYALEKESTGCPMNLDISYAVADDDCFMTFYQNASKLKIPSLCGLIWDGNRITSTTIESFTNFIKKQTNLTALSISRCFARAHQQKSLPFLIDLVRNKTFEQFCISSSKEDSFGSPLVGVIESLIHKSQLRILDITNQSIGDIGLFLILREMSPSLEELWFDGFAPTSPDVFLTICNKILQRTQLKMVSWPSSDITPVLAKVHIENRPETLRKINAVKNEFYKRFGEMPEDDLRTRIDPTVPSREKVPSDIAPPSISKDSLMNNLVTEEEYVFYDEETKRYLDECRDVIGKAPIITSINQTETYLSIANLLSKFPH